MLKVVFFACCFCVVACQRGLTSFILTVSIFVHFLINPAMRLKKSGDENGNVDQSFTFRKLLLVEMDS